MTELAVPDNRGEIVPASEPMTGLVKWAFDAQQANRIATSLSRTSFVPATMRGKPDDITAAILAGDELGLKPMASLRSMDIIQGTPALRAHAMRGLLQSHGHEIELVSSTEDRCEMRGRRKGSDAWQPVVWTIARAERLGLTVKAEWKKQPQTMLVNRATGELCRLVASDVLFAMPYASEELDGSIHEGSNVTVTRADVPTADEVMGTDTAALPAGPGADYTCPCGAVGEHYEDDCPNGGMNGSNEPAVTEPAASEPVATKAQLTKIHAALNQCAITDRTDKLATVGQLVGRTLSSSSDLSKAEASNVIETLDRLCANDNPTQALDFYLANIDQAGGES